MDSYTARPLAGEGNFGLAHTHFLITRPVAQATALSTQITALGGHSLLFPTITIEFLLNPENSEQLQQHLFNTDTIIFTSSNAVLAVMPYWPKNRQNPAIFAVGSGTAATLADFTIPAKTPESAFNSEGLLALPELQAVRGKTILICKGCGGRPFLAEQLRLRGAIVKEMAVYERRCPEVAMTAVLAQWRQTPLDFIISTSCESLENLYALVGTQDRNWLLKQQLLVISPRMETLAKKLGFKLPSIVAENASNAAILNAALQAVRHRKSATSQIKTEQ